MMRTLCQTLVLSQQIILVVHDIYPAALHLKLRRTAF